ncbi:hypothetical protein P175DRAFT_0503373 [Aspergillus ochraceoroseus IBT 24754]|uniref:Uncharacterized protein n=1 Tax=Aspergillus ochraceoroseus IBT 24754 TaxID=1392256 RepID=A0A2T5LQN1_9EURO|nr:uncharacterized protein P175DRAFT_0503373 [Aspergillus ochraceoroseus IBT 24754]PTU18579.1 hypothetical protein P175DRAFT_0503373 [Aspergillus ochraceoroseus IBT 24754]
MTGLHFQAVIAQSACLPETLSIIASGTLCLRKCSPAPFTCQMRSYYYSLFTLGLAFTSIMIVDLESTVFPS